MQSSISNHFCARQKFDSFTSLQHNEWLFLLDQKSQQWIDNCNWSEASLELVHSRLTPCRTRYISQSHNTYETISLSPPSSLRLSLSICPCGFSYFYGGKRTKTKTFHATRWLSEKSQRRKCLEKRERKAWLAAWCFKFVPWDCDASGESCSNSQWNFFLIQNPRGI